MYPMEKKCKRVKWLSGEALQIAMKRREVKSKGEKERYKHLQSSKEQKEEIRKPSSAINAKKQRKTVEWERLEITSKNQRYKGNMSSKDRNNKEQKQHGLNRNRKY